MRVIAGSAKSRKLIVPRGAEIRPTGDMVREALFASLAYQTLDARFADLYAGSGSVGIEALSRGARRAVFVENNPRCLQALRTNLENTGLLERADIIRGDCLARVSLLWQGEPPDIVFMDPPYRDSAGELLERVQTLARESRHACLIVVQCERGMEPPQPPDKSRRYGSTVLLYYEVAASSPASA